MSETIKGSVDSVADCTTKSYCDDKKNKKNKKNCN